MGGRIRIKGPTYGGRAPETRQDSTAPAPSPAAAGSADEPVAAEPLTWRRGAVLPRERIEALSKGDNPLILHFDPQCLKPAAYDLRIAPDGLVTPEGEYLVPGGGRLRTEPLIISPGETAFVSTYEQLRMPLNLVGNIFIKGALARLGIMLLTGSIVDPGWRAEQSTQLEGQPPTGRDGRLHFTLANLGKQPVAIDPMNSKVVSIQFMRIDGDPFMRIDGDGSGLIDTDTDRIWDRPPKGGLGFVERLAHLDGTVRDLKQTVERQERATEIVTVAAFFVLATTVLGVAFASILSAASDKRVTDQVRRAIPDDASHRLFVLTVILAAAWALFSVAQLVTAHQRQRPPSPTTDPEQRALEEALGALRWRRARNLVLGGCFVVGVGVAGIEALVWIGVDADQWWLVVLGAVALVAMAAWWADRLWSPIAETEVKQRAKCLRESKSSSGLRQRRARRGG